MDITIKTIPHAEQRYETCGDWWFDPDGGLQIRVSGLGNPRYEFLVARHELDEAMLCHHRGISDWQVTEFDKAFEEERASGEPGDDPRAPYGKEHFFATTIERLMAAEIGVDWSEYEAAIEAL